ncbi:unnamed protein product [Mycena citricolor]|uniref:Uncharacterized protein n=1 Tax=Mycena citricolor TaxID=2018698 RepID=A0AAD2HFL7_9AGAR|nr:unnamed protein product [Mycena citricolor]
MEFARHAEVSPVWPPTIHHPTSRLDSTPRVRHTHLLFQYHDGREFLIHDTTDFRVHSVVHLASSAEPPVVRCRLQCTTCRIIQRLIDRFCDRRELVKVAAKNHIDPTERFVRARRFPNPDVSRKNGEKIFTEHRYFVND